MKSGLWGTGALVSLLAGCAPQPPVEVIQEQPVLAAPPPVYTAPLDEATTLGADVVSALQATRSPDAVDPPQAAAPQADAVSTTTAPDTILITQQSGLIERLPNTCKLQDFQQFQGQPETILTGVAIMRAWRVVAPNAIITQEYDPGRVNFYTNGTGVIQRITCG